ncbi:MAG: transposase [Cyanobacteria bacterium P01_H01_bin.119]
MSLEIGTIEHFDSARQLAAFAGLTPQEHTQCISVRGKTRLCNIGNRRLHKVLYFPALNGSAALPPSWRFWRTTVNDAVLDISESKQCLRLNLGGIERPHYRDRRLRRLPCHLEGAIA